ncbi:hypothetical protein M430DRAFT_210408 [Amorphotheca resinae ATCC 22711]|uniref:Uncharacterized protein n=1 Tax=Amorphotheca resinae ATCC 22711 TaxID=857342 RepID=A0A2T3B7M5_AMORE|nr:hypothetical protein M430DRAFT_210408 [Amorphotheca resinae ATCC 22711]PSS22865.1 hypothetical protein M430DRAFT_210408 [Amorphotheca resinae ATCC 22711]
MYACKAASIHPSIHPSTHPSIPEPPPPTLPNPTSTITHLTSLHIHQPNQTPEPQAHNPPKLKTATCDKTQTRSWIGLCYCTLPCLTVPIITTRN